MVMKQIHYYLTLSLCLWLGVVQAQTPTFKNGYYTNTVVLNTGTTTAMGTVMSGILALPKNHPSTDIAKALLKVQLDLGENYTYGDLDFKFKANVTVYGENGSRPSENLCNATCLMEISKKVPERLYHFDFANKINKATPDYTRFKIVVRDVELTFGPDVSTATQAQVIGEIQTKQKIRVVADYNIAYKIDAATTAPNSLKAVVIERTANFTWSNNGRVMPNYQIQVMRLHNYADPTNNALAWANWATSLGLPNAAAVRAQVAGENLVLTEIDWSRALTFETSGSHRSATLTLAEGTGYYAWRVRPIGSKYQGGIANAKNWGQWSHGAMNPTLGTLGPVNLKTGSLVPKDIKGADLAVFYFKDSDENLNHIYSRTFTEGNRTSESITYATDLNQVKQTQTYLPSKKTTIITQQMYDYSGRPVMATLPVPVQNRSLKGYYESLVKTQGTNPADRKLYRPGHFDTDANYRNPTKIDQSVGNPFNYYTGKKQIPDAEGYAFTRTLFSSDGKVKEQSGVGKTHMIGGGGKTVKTFYATATESELIRLFGDEAPAASTVLKMINIDQNGTASISYTSKEGKVIATCLAYQDQSNLEKLDDAATRTKEKLLIDLNYQSFNKTVSAKRIYLVNASELTFNYLPECTNLSGCKFTFQIVIHKLDDDASGSWVTIGTPTAGQLDWGTVNGNLLTSVSTDVTCGGSVQFGNITLQPGSYLIEKQLTPKGFGLQQLPQAVVNSQHNVSANIKPLISMLSKWMEEVKCNSHISNFFAKVKTLENELNAATTAPQYAALDTKYQTDLGLGAGQLFFNSEHIVNLKEPYDIEINNPGCGIVRIPINLTTVFDFKNMTYGMVDANSDGKYQINPFLQFVSRKTEFFPDLEGFAYSFFWKVVPDTYSSELSQVISDAVKNGRGQILSETDFENAHIYLGGDLTPAELTLLGGYTHTEVKQRVKYIYYKFLAPYMKGWHEPGTFSLMIKHMLTDKYNANGKDKDGKVVEDKLEARKDGCNQALKLAVDATDANKTAQYYAEDLLECWQTELSRLKVQVDPDGGVAVNYKGNSGGISSHVDDRTGNPKIHDGAFDDALPKNRLVRWFLKWVLKSKLSKKMRNQQTSAGTNNGNNNQIDIQYEQHLVEEFLRCTGYRFAKILDNQAFAQGTHKPLTEDEISTLPATYYQDMFDPNATVAPRAKAYEGVDRGYYPDRDWKVQAGADNKFKYILDPVYAFKYFQYTMDKKKTVEVLTCYKDFNGCNYCGIGKVTCDITSKDWTTTQRDTYLQMLRTFKSGGVTGQYAPVIAGKDFASPTYIEPNGDVKRWQDDVALNSAEYFNLKQNDFKDTNGDRYLTLIEIQINKMNQQVVSICDSNRLFFKKMLVDTLARKCYKIVDCKGDEGDDDQISNEDIETLLDIMIEECKRRAMVTSYHRKEISCKFLDDERNTYTVPVIEYGVGGEGSDNGTDAKMFYRKQTISNNIPLAVSQNSEILIDNNITLTTKNYKGEEVVIKDLTGANHMTYFEWLRFLEVTTMLPLIDLPTVCNGQNVPSALDANPAGTHANVTDVNNSMPSPNKPLGDKLSPLTKRIVEMSTEEVVENGKTVTKKMVRVFAANPDGTKGTLLEEFEQK